MTNPKKNRKIFNIVLAIVLAVGVWMYVINVENPPAPVLSGKSRLPWWERTAWLSEG